jgi:NAD-dependent deacetylase
MGKIFIISGAGLSAESGVPTFRDANGLWHNHKIEDVCYISTWQQNYHLVHRFYNERRVEMGNVEPNAMHKAIAGWQKEFGKENVINVTTNVDDLLERAGVEDAVHLHGEITKIVDTRTGEIEDIGYTAFDSKFLDTEVHKPYVVFFGEHAPEYETLSAMTNFDMQGGDIVVFIGMSFVVVPVGMCLPWCRNVSTININPDPKTGYDHEWDLHIESTATEAITQLDRIIRNNLTK